MSRALRRRGKNEEVRRAAAEHGQQVEGLLRTHRPTRAGVVIGGRNAGRALVSAYQDPRSNIARNAGFNMKWGGTGARSGQGSIFWVFKTLTVIPEPAVDQIQVFGPSLCIVGP